TAGRTSEQTPGRQQAKGQNADFHDQAADEARRRADQRIGQQKQDGKPEHRQIAKSGGHRVDQLRSEGRLRQRPLPVAGGQPAVNVRRSVSGGPGGQNQRSQRQQG